MATLVKDIDDNSYKTVRIGDQVWMAENLKVTHYRNGDPIPNLTNYNDWEDTSQGAYCNYDNDENNVENYGRLYNWFSVIDKRGLALKGWHIPTDEEWVELVDCLGDDRDFRTNLKVVGGKLKAIGTIEGGEGLWNEPNTGATNESGFTALPGGSTSFSATGDYDHLGGHGFFWSSTMERFNTAYNWILIRSSSEIYRGFGSMGMGCSIRCIRD